MTEGLISKMFVGYGCGNDSGYFYDMVRIIREDRIEGAFNQAKEIMKEIDYTILDN